MLKRLTFFPIFLFLIFTLTSCEKGVGMFGTGYGTAKKMSEFFSNRRADEEKSKNCGKDVEGSFPENSIGEFLGDLSSITCNTDCPLSKAKSFNKTKREEEEGFLSFTNFTTKIFGLIPKQGKCRGHAIVTQQFNSLGVYCNTENLDHQKCQNDSSFECERFRICQADNKLKDGKDCTAKSTSRECTNFYKGIINDITSGKIRSIPGFTSLAEFSSHPKYKDLIKNKVKAHDANYTYRPGEVESITGSATTDKFLSFAKRIKQNHMPYIAIKKEGSQLGHGILGYKTIGDHPNMKICVRDSNSPRMNKEKQLIPDRCQSYLTIENDKVTYHSPERSVGLKKFLLDDTEDQRTLNYKKEYKKVCEKIIDDKNLCLTGN